MPPVTMSPAAQAEGMEYAAELMLAEARAAAKRLGLTELDGVVVLIHALSAGVSDMCGPNADGGRIRKATQIAARQIGETIPVYNRLRTTPNAKGPSHD